MHDSAPRGQYGLVVNKLFGIGLTRDIEGRHAEWIRRINEYRRPVLALDCPSGLNGDTARHMAQAPSTPQPRRQLSSR